MKNLLALFFVLMVVTVFNGLTLDIEDGISFSLDNNGPVLIADTSDVPTPAPYPDDNSIIRDDPFANFGNNE